MNRKDSCPECNKSKMAWAKLCINCYQASIRHPIGFRHVWYRWEEVFIRECAPFLTVNEMMQYLTKTRIQIIMECRRQEIIPLEEE